MSEFLGNLDYLFWLNAQEEASFQECLEQHRAEWPGMEDAQALARLRAGLLALLESGSIGIYAEKWSRFDSRRNLSLGVARAAVLDDSNWKSPAETEWFHHLYPASEAYRTRAPG